MTSRFVAVLLPCQARSQPRYRSDDQQWHNAAVGAVAASDSAGVATLANAIVRTLDQALDTVLLRAKPSLWSCGDDN
jgi:hypothetical protein